MEPSARERAEVRRSLRLLRRRYVVLMCVGPHPPTIERHHRIEVVRTRTWIGAQIAKWTNGPMTLGMGTLEIERLP